MKLIAYLLIVIIGLSGCISAQDNAIQAYCLSEAHQKYPSVLKVQTVQRMVWVGEKTTGYKTKCETTDSKKVKIKAQARQRFAQSKSSGLFKELEK